MFLARLDELPEELVASTITRDLNRGETLCRQGDPVEAVFAVEYGRLQMYTSTSEGKHVSIYAVRSGECVAEAALFAETYCSDVIAEIKSRVRAFPKKHLQLALQCYPKLAAELMNLQAKRCNALRISLELRSLRSARERILQYFTRALPVGSKSLELDRPLRSLADDLGLTHESFYRTLAELIDERLIIRAGKLVMLNEAMRFLNSNRMALNDRISLSAIGPPSSAPLSRD